MNKIEVCERMMDHGPNWEKRYHAQIKGESVHWACGDSEDEAIPIYSTLRSLGSGGFADETERREAGDSEWPTSTAFGCGMKTFPK